MHLFPQAKDIKCEFLKVDTAPQAQLPIWCASAQQPDALPLGEANKAFVLDTLWKAYRWQELREQIDESACGEHLILYRRQGEADGGERRLLVSTMKIPRIDRQRGNFYNSPFFRQALWDESTPIQDLSLREELHRFTGVEPSHAGRIIDVVDALGPRIREIIRFSVTPANNLADKCERLFECVWRCHTFLYEYGVGFVIAISEADSTVMYLYDILQTHLGQPLILPVARSMILNRETGVQRETVLYFIDTQPFNRRVGALPAYDLRSIVERLMERCQRRNQGAPAANRRASSTGA